MEAASGKRFEDEWPQLAAQLLGMLSHRGLPRFKREDIVQETGLRLFKMWDQVDPDRPVWPLAVTITLNLLRDEARRRPQREVLCEPPEVPDHQDVEHASLARIELKRVRRAMTGLSAEHQAVLLAELGEKRVVRDRGSAATKMMRLRARKKLHAVLDGVSASGFAAVFRFRKLWEVGAQVATGRTFGGGGAQLASAGVILFTTAIMAGLPTAPTGVTRPGLSDAIVATQGAVSAAQGTNSDLVIAGNAEPGPGSGGSVEDTVKAKAHKDAGRGSGGAAEAGPVEVPLPTGGSIQGSGSLEAGGFGVRVGSGGDQPACVSGVESPVGCAQPPAPSDQIKAKVKVKVDTGAGLVVGAEQEAKLTL